jgi:surface protein
MIPIRIGTMAVQGVISRFFVIQVNTAITGIGTVSSNNQFQLPALGTYKVIWGDATSQDITAFNSAQFVTHSYPSPGIYNITVVWQESSAVKQIYFNNTGDRSKLIDIKNWGTTIWTSMEAAFRGCDNLIGSFVDAPKLQAVTLMRYMFADAKKFVGNLSKWNTGSVTDMKALFQNAAEFNSNIGNWNVSSVTDISNMFNGCTAFNQGIGSWDVSSVETISSLFFGARSFNQNLDSWDTSSVLDMSDAFRDAMSFNGAIGSWTTTATTNMSNMFRNAVIFDQDIGGWNTANVTNMSEMFRETTFNQDIGPWDTSNVTNMNSMFQSALAFNYDISSWNVSSATTMNSMFRNAVSFDQPIGSWNTANVTDMSSIFRGATAFDENIGNWNVGSVAVFTDFMADKTTSTFSATNLDAVYNGWTEKELQTAKSITFGSAKYTAAGAEARALLTRTANIASITNVQNNGSGLIRITSLNHGLATGNKVFIKNVLGTVEANGAWTITVVDVDNIDLQGSTFVNAWITDGALRTGYGWTIVDGGL